MMSLFLLLKEPTVFKIDDKLSSWLTRLLQALEALLYICIFFTVNFFSGKFDFL